MSDWILPWRGLARFADRIDDRLARQVRGEFGQRGWLLSWEPEPGRGWRARLSSAATVSTIERTGPTRRAAIRRAHKAMDRLLEFRTRRERTRPAEQSTFDAWSASDPD
ncbi:MAG: hypothetical protein U0794_17425 [Isosphaeraceae bacterium]